MRMKTLLAAAVLATSALSVQAGGLLDEQVTVSPTAPPPAPVSRSSCNALCLLPLLAIPLLMDSDSGGGS